MTKPNNAKIKIVRGSGNVFRDLGRPDAELQQLKALLAVLIVRVLDERSLTVRKAESATKIAAADFSRIRNYDLGRFTVDRLMTVLGRLGLQVDVAVTVRRKKRAAPHVAAARSRNAPTGLKAAPST